MYRAEEKILKPKQNTQLVRGHYCNNYDTTSLRKFIANIQRMMFMMFTDEKVEP